MRYTTERTIYADHLLREHARFIAIAERNTRVVHILAGAAIACGIICLASIFLFLPAA